jgi:cell division GTPase FtsZ
MNWKVVEKGSNPGALIKVVGVGGCGGNAVDHMVNSGLENVETISINTDSQALDASVAEIKHCLGELTNSGQGAGANPDIGRELVNSPKQCFISATLASRAWLSVFIDIVSTFSNPLLTI